MLNKGICRLNHQLLIKTVSVLFGILFIITTSIPLASVIQAASFPSLRIEPKSIEFGSLEVGSLSPVKIVTITNDVDSTNVLTIFDIYVDGPDSDDFILMNDNCSGRILDGSISSTLEILFKPTTAGIKRAILMIPTNATTDPYELALSGTGVASNSNLKTESTVDKNDNILITNQISKPDDNSPSMSWVWVLIAPVGPVLLIILIFRTKRFTRK